MTQVIDRATPDGDEDAERARVTSMQPSGTTSASTAAPKVGDGVERRRAVGGSHPEDTMALIGALIGAAALSAILFYFVAPWSSVLGFVVVYFVVFLGMYAGLVGLQGDAQLVKDRLAAALAHAIAGLVLLALVVVVVFTVWQGRDALSHVNFYTESLAAASGLDPLTVGGMAHAAVGTVVMIGISLSMTIPLALVCAVFLSETRGRFTRFVRTIVEAMTALPSVVAGLFVYAGILLLQALIGKGQQSGIAAAIALSVMMLPIVIRAADVVLRLVAGNLKEAAAALGAPQWRVVWHVVLPTARSGLMTAIILGTARGIGETSPVLLTAGYSSAFNLNPFAEPMVSLPLLTFVLTRSGQASQITRGFGSAAALLAIVLILFVIARIIGGRSAGELSKRQAARRHRDSARDEQRMRSGRPQPQTVDGPPPAERTDAEGDPR